MVDKLVTTMSGRTNYDVRDEDLMTSNDATGIPTQQSVKAYVDNAKIVTLTAATTITKATHAGKTMLLSLAAGFTVTLPEATGSGDVYKFKVGIVRTSGSYVIAAKTTDTMTGFAHIIGGSAAVSGFLIDGTDDKLTLNGTTTGGLTIGDTIVLTDAQDTVWHVEAMLTGSGTIATPASAT